MENDEPALVSVVANSLRNLVYKYRDSLGAGFIVAGVDKRLGPQVYSLGINGPFQRKSLALGGSGSLFIFGHCDSNFKQNMSKEECVNFLTKGKI